jgi:hypothetical protein
MAVVACDAPEAWPASHAVDRRERFGNLLNDARRHGFRVMLRNTQKISLEDAGIISCIEILHQSCTPRTTMDSRRLIISPYCAHRMNRFGA